MQISGQIKTTCPPAFLLQMLNDPGAMTQILPPDSKLSKSGAGSFAFTVTKSVGPIRLTLPGTLTLTPKGKLLDQHLQVRAAHLIGGKVDLDLGVEIAQTDGVTRVSYDGELMATGLAGRILKEHRTRANAVVKAALTRLKLHAEAQFSLKSAAV